MDLNSTAEQSVHKELAQHIRNSAAVITLLTNKLMLIMLWYRTEQGPAALSRGLEKTMSKSSCKSKAASAGQWINTIVSDFTYVCALEVPIETTFSHIYIPITFYLY